jgi:hypothetical protein
MTITRSVIGSQREEEANRSGAALVAGRRSDHIRFGSAERTSNRFRLSSSACTDTARGHGAGRGP